MTKIAGDIELAEPTMKRAIASNLRGRSLQIRLFFGQNRPFYGADLQADAAVNAGVEVNPIPVCALLILARPFVDAGDWASIDAIGNAFADISDNSVGHALSLLDTNMLIKLSELKVS